MPGALGGIPMRKSGFLSGRSRAVRTKAPERQKESLNSLPFLLEGSPSKVKPSRLGILSWEVKISYHHPLSGIPGPCFVLQTTNPLDFILIRYPVPPQAHEFSKSEVKMLCINNSQLKPQKRNCLSTP